MHDGMVHASEMALAAGAKRSTRLVVGHPALEAGASSRPSASEKLGRQRLRAGRATTRSARAAWAGTRRRASSTSTTQPHDVTGLFIVDGSTVPGPLGVNPQLTIMAMARAPPSGSRTTQNPERQRGVRRVSPAESVMPFAPSARRRRPLDATLEVGYQP